MCDCQSYNRPEFGGTIPERILPYGQFFPGDKDTVCVDDCIAEAVLSLWSAGVKTVASCCGHNGKSAMANGQPNVMIADPAQASLASDILSRDGRAWWVMFWVDGE